MYGSRCVGRRIGGLGGRASSHDMKIGAEVRYAQNGHVGRGEAGTASLQLCRRMQPRRDERADGRSSEVTPRVWLVRAEGACQESLLLVARRSPLAAQRQQLEAAATDKAAHWGHHIAPDPRPSPPRRSSPPWSAANPTSSMAHRAHGPRVSFRSSPVTAMKSS